MPDFTRINKQIFSTLCWIHLLAFLFVTVVISSWGSFADFEFSQLMFPEFINSKLSDIIGYNFFIVIIV